MPAKRTLRIFPLVAAALFLWNGSLSAEPAFIGMQIQGVSGKVAQAMGVEKAEGVLVRDIALGGPADKSGIQRGDMLLKFNGKDIGTFENLVLMVKEMSAGDEVPLLLLRQGQKIEVMLEAGNWEPSWQVSKGSHASLPLIGLTVAAITPKVRNSFSLRWGTTGVVISLINHDKADIELKRGDVIHQVNQQPIWKPQQLVDLYAKAKKQKRKSLLLLVEGPSGFYFSILKVK